MKKLIILAMVAAFAVSFAGCDASDKTGMVEEQTEANNTNEAGNKQNADSLGAYKDILDSAYDVITGNKDEDYLLQDGETGLMELTFAGPDGKPYLLDKVGYAIRDLDNNGVEELIIGADSNSDGSAEILAMYTLENGKPVLVIDGFARSSYYMLDDGSFFHKGSGGAAYTMFGIYELSEDGKSLKCTDYYFSDFKDDEMSEIGWFHNTTGESDKENSELTEFEDDNKPYDIMEEYINEAADLDLTYFEDYVR